jgi:hypothetical protein
MIILSFDDELFHAEGQTDTHNEASSHFSEFGERA